jgi:hypothetical protein
MPMTEQEWLWGDDWRAMIHFALHPPGIRDVSNSRKWWLFAIACGRQNPHKNASEIYRLLLETLERYTDRMAEAREVLAALRQAGYPPDPLNVSYLRQDPCCFAQNEGEDIVNHRDRRSLPGFLLRDIFGNPFRPSPSLSSALVKGEYGLLVDLAQAAYNNRLLPSGYLDVSRLSVLADALEDAGCRSTDLIDHLRSPNPHVRGCWAVDALLAHGVGTGTG